MPCACYGFHASMTPMVDFPKVSISMCKYAEAQGKGPEAYVELGFSSLTLVISTQELVTRS